LINLKSTNLFDMIRGRSCFCWGYHPIHERQSWTITVLFLSLFYHISYFIIYNLVITNRKARDSEEMALSVDSCEGLIFVPAFSGLFCPHWRDDARGVIINLRCDILVKIDEIIAFYWISYHSTFHNKNHLVRAGLESTAFQIREVIDAMSKDTGRW